ncbi:MAG: hypothetical protein IT207_03825 [Fimbriimonadaceae bacterium]|nr:hypothetical protein [Fimbriimonadaceae bacterium]
MLAVLFAAAVQTPPSTHIELSRAFRPGDTLNYEFKTHLLSEQKQLGMAFYLPSEFSLDYKFSLAVQKVTNEGFGEIVYSRPVMRFTEGETADSPPKTKTEKVDWKVLLTLSPANEVTATKDLNPKKEKGKDGEGLYATTSGATGLAQDFVGDLVREVHGLAMFAGALDSSLDLSPKLPFEEVEQGDTWKRTVGFQPRQLKGSDEHAMQRLDYTYTYGGKVMGDTTLVDRVVATLSLETDAAPFLLQSMGVKPEDTGLKSIHLKLQTKIVYDLDSKTFATLKADAVSTGVFSITVKSESEAVVEEKFTGTASLTLLSRS